MSVKTTDELRSEGQVTAFSAHPVQFALSILSPVIALLTVLVERGLDAVIGMEQDPVLYSAALAVWTAVVAYVGKVTGQQTEQHTYPAVTVEENFIDAESSLPADAIEREASRPYDPEAEYERQLDREARELFRVDG